MVGLLRDKTKRRLLYGLLLILVFAVQTARGFLPRPFGAVCNLFPFLICQMAFSDGPYAGGVYGALAGLLLALDSGRPEGLDAAFYGLYGILCGVGATSVLRRETSTALACGAVLSLLRALLGWLVFYGLAYSAPFWSYMGQWLLGLCWSLLLFYPANLLLRTVARRFHEDVL